MIFMNKDKGSFFCTGRGFSLTELVIILVIVAIAVALGVPSYRKAMQRAQEKEVTVFSEALRDAEHQYYLEHGRYVRCNNTGTGTQCNEVLQVSLPAGGTGLWNYFVRSDNLTSYFCVGARKIQGGDTLNYCLPGDIDQKIAKTTCDPAGCQ